mmetsp:Transcript_70168/g.141966  ORF Transcript_70168/g.141966 Transcript_70168/m.141966 type:complete len:131 (-) Transcript_70168:113-505(-)
MKSDHFNALQSSFYVCCSGFDRRKFEDREVAKLLGNTFNYLVTTRIGDPNQLEILQQVDSIRTSELDENITQMLDRIEKLRLIHEQSRKWHERWEDQAPTVVTVPPSYQPLEGYQDRTRQIITQLLKPKP